MYLKLIITCAFFVSFGALAELKITEKDRSYWAYKPLTKPLPPQLNEDNWSQHPVDKFILRKLKENQLLPSQPAHRRDLIRRAYFDLTGLPPKPQEVEAFVNNKDPQAYENLIDKLLASPRYGERWGRHWLDLVRYAESDGYRGDFYRTEAYKYRDYVIRSFNKDKSYKQFVMEQLAGDEIAPEDPDALIATGFMRLPIYEWNQRDTETHWETILQDVTDVTADVFLGTGLQCAKCHDHKFDPILRKDYYALKAFFAPMIWRDDVPIAGTKDKERKNSWEKAQESNLQKLAEIEAPHRAKAYKKAIIRFPKNIQEIMKIKEEERTPYQKQMAYLVMRQAYYEWNRFPAKKKIEKEQKALFKTINKGKVKLPKGMTASDVGSTAPPTKIPGNEKDIQPGFMTVLYPEGADVDAKIFPVKAKNSTGRRTALAKWITSPNNQLTNRVIVNRIWQYHFGRGLAGNPNDFGKLGEKPTHPELLDWLTQRFIEMGWRFKPMHKMIMMSETYKQSSINKHLSRYMKIDPQNKLLWRMTSRRLEAEAIRDSILAVSGELKFRSTNKPSISGNSPERSVFIKVVRNEKDEFLNAFDWADGFASNAVRNVTTTPVQSLLMINGGWVQKRSQAFSKKLISKHNEDSAKIINELYQTAYGRTPEKEELSLGQEFIKAQQKTYLNRSKDLNKDINFTAKMKNGLNAITSHGRRDFYQLLTKDVELLTKGDFTVEARIQMNSIHPDSSLRVITSQSSSEKTQGLSWALCVTGKKSRYKPGLLVLRLGSGKDRELIISDLQMKVGVPYYVGLIADTDGKGTKVSFYLKEEHKKTGILSQFYGKAKSLLNERNSATGNIVMFTDKETISWDGMIGEMRLSRKALSKKDLMIEGQQKNSSTVAHWHFESDEELLKDASKNGYHLHLLKKQNVSSKEAFKGAITDLCQVIFNSSEFLYVR